MPPRYDMLAIDLDGTLLDRQGRVSPANIAAVRAARDRGLAVHVCTGRGLVECLHVLEAIEQVEPVVVAGGAIIACPKTQHTQHRFAVEPDLVRESVAAILDHGHAALVLKDPLEAGYDYLVVHGPDHHPLDPVTKWWFSSMNVRVRTVTHLHEDEHPEHTVRVGACGKRTRLAGLKSSLASAAGERAIVHHFPAVVAPDHTIGTHDGDRLDILELFDQNANKWSAVSLLAQRAGIPPARIAAIGDEVNDVCMIQNAGLGVAMGNAIPEVKQAADRHTAPNHEGGVAMAIHKILDGEW